MEQLSSKQARHSSRLLCRLHASPVLNRRWRTRTFNCKQVALFCRFYWHAKCMVLLSFTQSFTGRVSRSVSTESILYIFYRHWKPEEASNGLLKAVLDYCLAIGSTVCRLQYPTNSKKYIEKQQADSHHDEANRTQQNKASFNAKKERIYLLASWKLQVSVVWVGERGETNNLLRSNSIFYRYKWTETTCCQQIN